MAYNRPKVMVFIVTSSVQQTPFNSLGSTVSLLGAAWYICTAAWNQERSVSFIDYVRYGAMRRKALLPAVKFRFRISMLYHISVSHRPVAKKRYKKLL